MNERAAYMQGLGPGVRVAGRPLANRKALGVTEYPIDVRALHDLATRVMVIEREAVAERRRADRAEKRTDAIEARLDRLERCQAQSVCIDARSAASA